MTRKWIENHCFCQPTLSCSGYSFASPSANEFMMVSGLGSRRQKSRAGGEQARVGGVQHGGMGAVGGLEGA